MKKVLFIILTLCSLNAFSQTLTVTRSGNSVLFIRSGQETIQVGANEYFDCFRNSNDTTKIIISHGRMNGSPIWDKTSIVSVGGVSSIGLGATDIARQIKDLVSALNIGWSNTSTQVVNLVTTAPTFGTSIPATQPAQAQLIMASFNTTPPTPLTGQSIPLQVDKDGNLKTANTLTNGTGTQVGASITLGGTAQVALALNPLRAGFEIINTSAADLFINISGVATTTSIKIPAGASYSRYTGKIYTNAISIIGATTGQAFTVLEIN